MEFCWWFWRCSSFPWRNKKKIGASRQTTFCPNLHISGVSISKTTIKSIIRKKKWPNDISAKYELLIKIQYLGKETTKSEKRPLNKFRESCRWERRSCRQEDGGNLTSGVIPCARSFSYPASCSLSAASRMEVMLLREFVDQLSGTFPRSVCM